MRDSNPHAVLSDLHFSRVLPLVQLGLIFLVLTQKVNKFVTNYLLLSLILAGAVGIEPTLPKLTVFA